MVGVNVDSSSDELSSTNNVMIKYMLKQRENHAKAQKHDYSHVFRRKTRFEMFRLSAIAMGIEFAYAAETSFVSPILLQIGIDHKHMTMAWGLSPLIGFFVSPFLGSVSDRCHLSFGRRRPIITLLSVGILIGLILVPYGKDLGLLLGDEGYTNGNVTLPLNSNYTIHEGSVAAQMSMDSEDGGFSASKFKFAAILTILGMVLLDFDADTCQTPARTYLLDMCIPEDQPKALTMFTLFAGVGGTIGYAIGGVDWESTNIGSFLGGNIPTVFALVTIIFFFCYLLTVTTFREVPLKLIEQDDMLRPLSAKAIKKELQKNNTNVFYIQENSTMDAQTAAAAAAEKYTVIDRYQGVSETSNGSVIANVSNGHASNGQPQQPPKLASKAIDINEIDDDDKPVSLKKYLKSIFVMPKSMRILALTNLLCWMCHLTYCLYFTDFVGEAVFHGDPMAAPDSEEAALYEAGVRFGCWGMSIYALSCSVYSMTVEKLMKWFGTKSVYISGILFYGVGMLILGLWPTKWGVLFFSTSAGILYGTIFTMPYILVAKYHAKNCFRVRDGETVPLKQARGLGTDVAIISSMVFVGQLIVSVMVGPIVAWMQTTCAILYLSTILAFFAAISAMFVLYV
ncbi:proton-associated sugar transporter A [Musca domestica]|uniref:Proton-associated sugar transporter A n=1 Tax=Musca domestica TaxID=7370 RepID=A0A1I8NIK0_MUSDO|nr:proton-associated sugar transporter A [Musca domestica]XP_058984390.1 proton-associated sugar transporter A [Musca domestica]XP_058984391.1 proton-associated sugar transporter A [Musca domestica]